MARTLLRVSVFFFAVAILLTWPILLRPERIYLTAPAGYAFVESSGQWYVTDGTGSQEYVDHVLHMREVEYAVERLLSGEFPRMVQPEFTVPPTYILSGAIITVLLPVSTVVFHNLFFVVSMALAGVWTFLFVREVVKNSEVALLSGVLYMSSFYIFNAYLMGHTNQWQLQWIPLLLYGVERVHHHPGGRNIAILGIALALQILSSQQYAVYLSFVLPLYVGLRYACGAKQYGRFAAWKGFGAAGVLAAVLTAPYLVTELLMAGSGETQTYSMGENASPQYVLSMENVIGVFFALEVQPQFWFRLALFFLGTVSLLVLPRRRQLQLVPFVVLFVVGIVLSWGPFAPWAPYAILYQYWPFIEYFRVPYRMLPFALLGSSTVSAGLLLHVTESDDHWTQRGLILVVVLTSVQILLVNYLLQFESYLL